MRRAVLALERSHGAIERVVGYTHHDLAEELDEATPRVVGEACVARRPDQALQRLGVEPEIEDRVHHSRHRHRRARAHRDEQRVRLVAEALVGLALEFRDMQPDVGHQTFRQSLSFEVSKTRRGGDDEPGRHVEADLGHRTEVRPLAAQQHLVAGVALGERVDQFRGNDFRAWRSEACLAPFRIVSCQHCRLLQDANLSTEAADTTCASESRVACHGARVRRVPRVPLQAAAACRQR